MYINRLLGLSGEMSVGLFYPDPLDTNPVFMFGTFDPADDMSSDSIRALDEAIFDIRETGDDDWVASPHPYCHAALAPDGSSSAFMFGVHPAQPSPARLGELALYLFPAELD